MKFVETTMERPLVALYREKQIDGGSVSTERPIVGYDETKDELIACVIDDAGVVKHASTLPGFKGVITRRVTKFTARRMTGEERAKSLFDVIFGEKKW